MPRLGDEGSQPQPGSEPEPIATVPEPTAAIPQSQRIQELTQTLNDLMGSLTACRQKSASMRHSNMANRRLVMRPCSTGNTLNNSYSIFGNIIGYYTNNVKS
jgi:hypothetical protein